MAQFGRPSGDITVGAWLGDPSGTPLYVNIDEAVLDINDFIISDVGPVNSACEVRLTSLNDPLSSKNHIVRYQYAKDTTGGATIDFDVNLLQGTGIIASWSHVNIPFEATPATNTLTFTQADSITDYGNLRLKFIANQTGGSPSRRVQMPWAEMEIPSTGNPDAHIDLYAPGHATGSGIINLYTSGYAKDSGSINLYAYGYDKGSGSINLYTVGPLASSGSMNLVTKGHATSSGSINLFTWGHIKDSGSLNLFTWGHLPDSGFLNLFLKAPEPFSTTGNTTSNINLFTHGFTGNISGAQFIGLNLVASGGNQSNAFLNLFLKSPNSEVVTKTLNVFTQGEYNKVGASIDLFLQNTGGNTKINLFARGMGIGGIHGTSTSGVLNFFIGRNNTDYINMFCASNPVVSGIINLFAKGAPVNSGYIYLVMKGIGFNSGLIDLYTHGF